MYDADQLLIYAQKQIANLRSGEIFLVKDLFHGYEWKRIPVKDRLLLGTLFFNATTRMNGAVVPLDKANTKQQKYKKM